MQDGGELQNLAMISLPQVIYNKKDHRRALDKLQALDDQDETNDLREVHLL